MILTEPALNDLDEILGHIQRDNPVAAVETIDRVLAAIDGLTEFPNMGRAGRVAGTRELVVPGQKYVVAYRIRGDCVEVARVRHGARRWLRRV